jgi:predicted hydrolase (HD superfamily)
LVITPATVVSVDEFQWELAGMFHDIAYPIDIAKDIMKPYADKINEITRNLGARAEIR